MRKKINEVAEVTKLAGFEFTKYMKYVENGEIIAIRALNLKNGRLVLDDVKRITRNVSEELPRSQLHKYDIVLSYTGTIGEIAQIMEEGKYHLAPNVAKIVPNQNEIDPQFLFQYMRSYEFKQQMFNYAHGSTQPTIPMSTIRELTVPIFDLETEKKIACILNSIDKKIELNNKINDNLQAQARSIYKAWFEQYIPFDGIQPDSWKKGKLKDVLTLKRNAIKAGENTELPYLPIDVIPMNTFALSGVKPNEEAQSSLITFDKDDIVIGAMRVYFHRVIIAPFAGITRTTCFTLSPSDKEYLCFGLLCCDQDSSIEFAQTTSKGSTMPYAIWDGGLGDMDIVIPDKNTAHEFNEIVMPMIRTIQSSYEEIKHLCDLRDGLLPRLMSGEIDVTDIDL